MFVQKKKKKKENEKPYIRSRIAGDLDRGESYEKEEGNEKWNSRRRITGGIFNLNRVICIFKRCWQSNEIFHSQLCIWTRFFFFGIRYCFDLPEANHTRGQVVCRLGWTKLIHAQLYTFHVETCEESKISKVHRPFKNTSIKLNEWVFSTVI